MIEHLHSSLRGLPGPLQESLTRCFCTRFQVPDEAVAIADRISQKCHHDWIEAFLVSHREVRLADPHREVRLADPHREVRLADPHREVRLAGGDRRWPPRLIAHGEHLTHRCSGWTENLHRQRGWAPEVA